MIQYSHGHIRILDRKGMEAFACECYRVVKDETDRLMGKRDKKLLTRSAAAGRHGEGRKSS